MTYNKNYVYYSHLGITFIVSFAVCFLLGYYLDSQCQTQPWFTLLGFGLGFCTAMWVLTKEINKK